MTIRRLWKGWVTPKATVTKESPSERNQQFRDNASGKVMSRSEFVAKIEKGAYPDYHVRNIKGTKTPASNPDKSTKNNLD